MSSPPLAPCRHRSGPVAGEMWICSSPKVVAPGNRVTSDTCRNACPYVNHEFDPRFSLLSGELQLVPRDAPQPARPKGAPVLVRPRPELFSLGMITAPRATPVVEESVRQLRLGGFEQSLHLFAEPESPWQAAKGVSVHRHPARLGSWGNFRFAAEYLLEQSQVPFLLLCEDDILLSHDAALGLQHAVETLPTENLGYLSLYTPWHNVIRQRLQKGWQALPVGGNTWGALAYCFSRDSLRLVLDECPPADPQRTVDADIVISSLFAARGRACYFHLPSLCAHAGRQISTLGHNNLPESDAIDFSPTCRTYVSAAEDIRPAARQSPTAGKETIFALTSLAPAQENVNLTRAAIQSWRNAGLHVCAFQHPTEIGGLAKLYDVEFVPVEQTSANVFGRHYIPIHAMLDWAAEQQSPVLIINSDIELRLAEWELARLRWLADGGLCYFVRYNHDGNLDFARQEPLGIDAFLLHGRDAPLVPRTFLSMGQPAWDYWLPHTFAAAKRAVYAVEFPAAFHRVHPLRWSWDDWLRCMCEFDRVANVLRGDTSFEACCARAVSVRESFDQHRVPLPARPCDIKAWVRATFSERGPKTFLELGAHQGVDTCWLADVPDVTVHAFEPDPRNEPPPRPNVILHRAAIAERDGRAPLVMSLRGFNREWTYSSSLKRPKNHLRRYPVTFGPTVEVETVSLDTFCRQHGIGPIDLIFADIQGAEGEMIRGGQETLSRTRYLYTEYSNDELYENQITLSEILKLLPDFRVLELWPDDVLLENKRLS